MSTGRKPDRREFISLGLGAFVVAATPALWRPRARLARRSVPVMGTVADVAVVHRDEAWAQRAIDAALAELRRVERAMTRFRDDSDVGRSNLAASRAPVPVGSETAEVLREALRWARASDGAFDPCLGRATALWDVERRLTPPRPGETRALAGRRLWTALEVVEGSVPRVAFHDPDVALDLGGIAKGWGVDRAADALRDHGVLDALVNVGGDLVALGASPEGDPWRVGVRSPEAPDGLAATLEVADEAVATSGDYLRFFRHGGRRYHHLLDPATGEPRRSGMRTLTVAAERCVTADAAATTAFGAPAAHARDVLARAAADARITHTG